MHSQELDRQLLYARLKDMRRIARFRSDGPHIPIGATPLPDNPLDRPAIGSWRDPERDAPLRIAIVGDIASAMMTQPGDAGVAILNDMAQWLELSIYTQAASSEACESDDQLLAALRYFVNYLIYTYHESESVHDI